MKRSARWQNLLAIALIVGFSAVFAYAQGVGPGAISGVTAGGVLSGNYPNPGIANLTTNALLTGNGTSLPNSVPITGLVLGNGASAPTASKVTLTQPATGSTVTVADGKILTANNTLTFSGTDSSSVAFGTGGTIGGVGYAANGQVPGVASNTAATASNIGEAASANAAAVSLVSNTGKTVTSVSLTAGEWMLSGVVCFNPAGTTTMSFLSGGFSQTNNAAPASDSSGGSFLQQETFTTGGTECFPTGLSKQSLSGTTSVFLTALAIFGTSTMTVTGTITGWRIH